MLLNWGLTTRRQGSRGTCSVFTVTGALEFALAVARNHGTRLSVEFLNWGAHQAANRAEDGGFFAELWEGYQEFGICADSDLPYEERFDVKLQPGSVALRRAKEAWKHELQLNWIKEWDPETGVSECQLAHIRATLANQWPVCGGFRWPKQPAWIENVLQFCPADEVFDGHSVLLVGYRDDPQQPGGGVFLIRNSACDGCDGLLAYDYVRAYMNDAVWFGAHQPVS